MVAISLIAIFTSHTLLVTKDKKMAENYRIKYKLGKFEVEVESTDKSFVEAKLNELIKESSEPKTKLKRKTPTKNGSSSKSESSKVSDSDESSDESSVEIMNIVNAITDSDRHEDIEQKILKKKDVLNRVLMVFYFVNKEYGNNISITTGYVVKITDQLGVKIKQPNVARKIKDNLKYFSAEKVRKRGAIIPYKINRKGIDEYDRIISS